MKHIRATSCFCSRIRPDNMNELRFARVVVDLPAPLIIYFTLALVGDQCYGDPMAEANDQVATNVDLNDLAGLIDGEDSLLDGAVKRLRAEESGDLTSWFKHGQHGSHSSFAG